MGNFPDYAPQILKENIVPLTMSMSDETLVDTMVTAVQEYEQKHVSKLCLGKHYQRFSNLFHNDAEFMEDMISYEQHKVQSPRLKQFMHEMGYPILSDLPIHYQQDY